MGLIGFLCIFGLLATSFDRATAAPTVKNTPKYFVAIGDSYTASGFNGFDTYPNDRNPFGNPPPGEETVSGGYNWLHYLTLKYNTSLTYAYNFAFTDAVTDVNVVSQRVDYVIDAMDQLNEEYLPKVKDLIPCREDAIYILFIGINDIDRGITLNRRLDTILTGAFASRQKIVDALYKTGARKFLFLNIPPVDRTPENIDLGATIVAKNKQWIAAYNEKLATFNQNFRKSHSDIVVHEYDTHAFFTTVLDNPQGYGFSNSSTGIGPGNYPNIWYNDYHPGYAFDNLWARDLASKIKL